MSYKLKFFLFLLCIVYVTAMRQKHRKPMAIQSRISGSHDEKVSGLINEVMHDKNKLNVSKSGMKRLEKNSTVKNHKAEKAKEDLLSARLGNSWERNAPNEKCFATVPKNCQEVKQRGHSVSGIFLIQPEHAPKPFFVSCDLDTDGGGWTYLLNRFDGFQNFNKSWNDYKQGFGNIAKEFWLGLENLHQLTGFQINELLVELVDWYDTNVYARYTRFSVGSEEEGYIIKILDGYTGNAGDSLIYHAGSKFSTTDKDQDNLRKRNCALEFGTGWWFNACRRSLLTGKYMYGSGGNIYEKMHWDTANGDIYNLKQVRMLIRPLPTIC